MWNGCGGEEVGRVEARAKKEEYVSKSIWNVSQVSSRVAKVSWEKICCGKVGFDGGKRGASHTMNPLELFVST